jgi:hypothetical protein
MNLQAMLAASRGVLNITTGIAWSFVLLLFVIQIISVLTKGIGGEKIEHALSLKSLLLVAGLLVFYDQLITWIIGFSNDIQEKIIPADFVVDLNKSIAEAIERYKQENPESKDSYSSFLGYLFFGDYSVPVIILNIAVVFMKVSFLVINYLSNIAKNFLYVIGPFAIVTAVIPGASVLKGWIKGFIEVSFWPIMSGVFYQMVAAGAKGVVTARGYEEYFNLLAMCIIIAILNVLTPLIVHSLSNNQGLGSAATWAAAGATMVATKGMSAAKSRVNTGVDYLKSLKGGDSKERRPGDV